MMNNTRYDFTSMTPVKTRGLAGKHAIPRMVISVLQRIFCQFLNDRFLLISVSPSNDLPIFDQYYQAIYTCWEEGAILVTVEHSREW
jgi:hypothetical protein